MTSRRLRDLVEITHSLESALDRLERLEGEILEEMAKQRRTAPSPPPPAQNSVKREPTEPPTPSIKQESITNSVEKGSPPMKKRPPVDSDPPPMKRQEVELPLISVKSLNQLNHVEEARPVKQEEGRTNIEGNGCSTPTFSCDTPSRCYFAMLNEDVKMDSSHINEQTKDEIRISKQKEQQIEKQVATHKAIIRFKTKLSSDEVKHLLECNKIHGIQDIIVSDKRVIVTLATKEHLQLLIKLNTKKGLNELAAFSVKPYEKERSNLKRTP